MREKFGAGVVLLIASLVLCWQGDRYHVTQDDAFTAFVYAKNLATGQGLTFNPSERVEGYTNFLWVLIMTLPHLLSSDIPRIANLLAVLCTVATVVLLYFCGQNFRPQRPMVFALVAPILLATNGAMAFWTFSGMETALFTLLLTAGGYRYIRDLDGTAESHWTGALFGLAALTRPEGLLAFGITSLHHLIATVPRNTATLSKWFRWTIPFFILVVPHFAFRYYYYDQLLPNTFYAKSAPRAIALQHGIEYTWDFLSACGLWGLILISPLTLLSQRRRRWGSYAALMLWAYTAYIVLIGGDVLGAQRFYVPLLPLIYLTLQEGIYELARKVPARGRGLRTRLAPGITGAVFAVTSGMVWHSYKGLDEKILDLRRLVVSHNDKLHGLVAYLNDQPDTEKLVVATSAIGIPRYFTQARVIDLLGLTDAEVAHSSETISGLDTPSILRRQHTDYVLAEVPDIFFFITGAKPHHIAEKALFLSRRFRRYYYMTYMGDELPAYTQKKQLSLVAEAKHPHPAFIADFSEGISHQGRDWVIAKRAFTRCAETAPADFAYPLQYLGQIAMIHGHTEEARAHFEHALTIDDHCVKALAHLAYIDLQTGRHQAALPHARRAAALSPYSIYCQFILGLALLANNLTEEALASFQQVAAKVGPNQQEATFFLGLTYKNLGREQEARKAWEAVLAQEPDHQKSALALTHLNIKSSTGQ